MTNRADYSNLKIDRIDFRIMQLLQREARITNQALAERINLSASSCLQRVRKLESQGVIQSYRAKLGLSLIARHISCVATVSLTSHTSADLRDFETLVESIPEIVECLMVSGEFDLFLKIICADMQRYLVINDQLVNFQKAKVNINTHVVMAENKKVGVVDLRTLRDY